ncbi:hypothetical protein A1D25_01975 [Ursidibacter arcticus]|uniref:HvfX family Cu-binding RiPP maturation protein n=1 Tax=Ursidibacter arcticus TaxID=1524965 RepID=UPI0012FCE8F0|nr:DoxX family protein [Ursidibacter arcticus]KAE9531128.1 hypothetical protein A1D25_01975 [Ursidibacter arcticus]
MLTKATPTACQVKCLSATGLGLLGLRLFLAYEFLEAGIEKWNGENWFGSIQDQFPFPFHLLPADFNWVVAMGSELLFPVLLAFGLFTRFSALSLAVLTLVAWYAVHAGLGYNVCNSGFKMPLIYLITLLPLLMQGAGFFSVDYFLQKKHSTYNWLKFL